MPTESLHRQAAASPALVEPAAPEHEDVSKLTSSASHSEEERGPGSGSSSDAASDLTAARVARRAARRALRDPRSGLLDLCLLPLRILGLPTSPADFFTSQLLPSVLSLGPIPRHIGFIMDGNRRFALASSLTVKQGHLSGFQTLKKILEACLSLKKVECVTVYAFAIDNFKRSPEEVSALMDLAKTRLIELTGHGELIARHSVRVRVIGRKHLLPPDVRSAVEKIEKMTRNHTR